MRYEEWISICIISSKYLPQSYRSGQHLGTGLGIGEHLGEGTSHSRVAHTLSPLMQKHTEQISSLGISSPSAISLPLWMQLFWDDVTFAEKINMF